MGIHEDAGKALEVELAAIGAQLGDHETRLVALESAVPPPVVELVDIIISPPGPTLVEGTDLLFAATGVFSDGSSAPIAGVEWSAIGGAISAAGLFTAGAPGAYTISARDSATGVAAQDVDGLIVAQPQIPPPGDYETVIADDWSDLPIGAGGDLGIQQALKARDFFTYLNHPFEPEFTELVEFPGEFAAMVVADPVIGKAIRITQGGTTDGVSAPVKLKDGVTNLPRTVQAGAVFRPLTKCWYRSLVRFQPGWLAEGVPSGMGDWKMQFIDLGDGSQMRITCQGDAFLYKRQTGQHGPLDGHTNLIHPDPAQRWMLGSKTGDQTDGHWVEFVMYMEILSPTEYRTRWWRRVRSRGGVLVDEPFMIRGDHFSAAQNLAPAEGIKLGVNMNERPFSSQFAYFGPYEVVDGEAYPDPWGLAGDLV
jgi:hypothetical protein